jgi:hypothetical protein
MFSSGIGIASKACFSFVFLQKFMLQGAAETIRELHRSATWQANSISRYL